jgi:hypothetical protein
METAILSCDLRPGQEGVKTYGVTGYEVLEIIMCGTFCQVQIPILFKRVINPCNVGVPPVESNLPHKVKLLIKVLPQ